MFRPATDPALPPTVLVTGAARRLGRDMALALAAAGWRVAVHCRASRAEAEATAALCSQSTPGAAVFEADLADEAATRALLPAVLARMGQVDALVNNASLFEHDSADTLSHDSLMRHLRSNTAAPILLAQALATHVQARQAQGVVVNLLDQKLWNQNPDFFSYTLSKAALEAATTMLALKLAPQVRVVGVAPGLTLPSPWLDEAEFAALHRLSPLQRSSTPADVAAAVLFALSNPALTGTSLLVDGGQHLQRFERDFSMMKAAPC